MNILIAFEESGEVREAFRRKGHHAISCDLLPSLKEGPHIIGDVRPLLAEPWDMVIAFPPCTFLSKIAQHLLTIPGRRTHIQEAVQLFQACLNANAPHICVENPQMHQLAASQLPRHSQVIQPFHYGHPQQKHTRLWLKNLPPLMASYITPKGPPMTSWRGSGWNPQQRARKASHTFPGIARAMADQWP